MKVITSLCWIIWCEVKDVGSCESPCDLSWIAFCNISFEQICIHNIEGPNHHLAIQLCIFHFSISSKVQPLQHLEKFPCYKLRWGIGFTWICLHQSINAKPWHDPRFLRRYHTIMVYFEEDGSYNYFNKIQTRIKILTFPSSLSWKSYDQRSWNIFFSN